MEGMEGRFWPKVDKSDECWEWTAATRNGYGVLGVRNGDGRWVALYAHRISWELHFGPIPDRLFVLHHCDNRRCVRPDHLWLGTNRDNLADMRAKGRGHILPPQPKGLWQGRAHPDRRGEANPRARLSISDVQAIRVAYGDGVGPTVLGVRYGVTRGHIHHIVRGRAWQ